MRDVVEKEEMEEEGGGGGGRGDGRVKVGGRE